MAAVAAIAVGLGGLVVSASPVLATAIPPSVSVSDAGGTPASHAGVGDALAVTASAPINLAGVTGQSIAQTWNPAEASINPATIVHPEGWTQEYTTDGATWTSTLPGDPTTITGIRSAGAVTSNGTAGGLQVSTSSGVGGLAPYPSFAGSGGGDGWDAFVSGAYVLNAYHHNAGTYNLACHLVATGASCGALYSVAGYETSQASSGTTVVSGKIYSIVGKDTVPTSYGVLCTNVASLPFTSCGYTVLQAGSGAYNAIGSASTSGTKIYAPLNLAGGDVVCFDTSTALPCVGQPYALYGSAFAVVTGGGIPVFSTAVGSQVFVTANHVWCFNAADGSACAGTWPAGTFSSGNEATVVPMRNGSGTVIGVCMIAPSGSCFTLAGAVAAFPAGLTTLLASQPVGAATIVGGWGQYDFNGTRQYWFAGPWGGPDTAICYDWATDAACAGFQTSTPVGNLRYTMRVDATNPNCIWTNGDNGVVAPFDANTGAAGCAPIDPVVDIPYTTVVPRLSCAEVGRIRNWQNITLTTPGAVAVTSLRVTVKDSSGSPIGGYTNLTPNGSGFIDLSALSVATSGTHPTFELTAPGASAANALLISAAVTYTSDGPQLCFTLTTLHECTSLSPGLSTGPLAVVPDLTLGGQVVATTGGAPTTTPLSADVTRANMAACVGTISGTALQTFAGGQPSQPLAGRTVYLLDSHGAFVASTVTAADGTYTFNYANPATYTASFSGIDHAVTVTPGSSIVQDFAVPFIIPSPHATFTQLGGANRDGTAALLATTMYPTAGSAPVAVLARDDLYADGLTGSPLANSLGGPLLLTPPAQLSAETQAAIGSVLRPGGLVVILGGDNAISPDVAATVQGLGYQVLRIGGADRYATAVLIAAKIATKHTVGNVYLATGLNFADALSAADAAGLTQGAVLLTADSTMPAETQSWLSAYTGQKPIAVGGAAAGADPAATPIVGTDRYATAAQVASSVAPKATGIVVATGANFPDGLAGAVYAVHNNWSLLLVDPTAAALDRPQSDYLHAVSTTATAVTAVGGTATLPTTVTSLVTAGLI